MKSDVRIEYVFVLLVYRNTEDVLDIINDIKAKFDSYRVVIVNSFYDESTDGTFAYIAKATDSDYVSVPNKGYGFGNDQGIKFANEKYDFEYLIVANPDTRIARFDPQALLEYPDAVYCPSIETARGKNQNPLWATFNPVSEWFMYHGYRSGNRLLVTIGIAANKIIREFFLACVKFFNTRSARVYAPHGSFLIFSKKSLETLGVVFDQKMFLFSEEMYLARRLRFHGIPLYMTQDILIHHKQDGSMSVAKIDEHGEGKKSYMYYYEKRKTIDREGR